MTSNQYHTERNCTQRDGRDKFESFWSMRTRRDTNRRFVVIAYVHYQSSYYKAMKKQTIMQNRRTNHGR